MPRSKKTTASATVTKSAIDYATSTLVDLPEKPKENWSLREAVAHLQVQISSALSKGYSYEEVARMLTEKGIEISASSLKSYLSAAKRQKETTTAKTGRAGRRTRRALGEDLVTEAAPDQSSTNGTGAKASKGSSKAKQEPTLEDSANGAALTKRRTRSSAQSDTSATQQSAASKTAAKSKSTPRTQSTAKATKGTRGKRQKQA